MSSTVPYCYCNVKYISSTLQYIYCTVKYMSSTVQYFYGEIGLDVVYFDGLIISNNKFQNIGPPESVRNYS